MWQIDKGTGLNVFRQTADSHYSHYKTDNADNGVEVWSDGSYYCGNFRDGAKQGNGVYFWADGSRYSGDWLQDEMAGQGTFTWADGRNFEGTFKDGMMNG